MDVKGKYFLLSASLRRQVIIFIQVYVTSSHRYWKPSGSILKISKALCMLAVLQIGYDPNGF